MSKLGQKFGKMKSKSDHPNYSIDRNYSVFEVFGLLVLVMALI